MRLGGGGVGLAAGGRLSALAVEAAALLQRELAAALFEEVR